MRPYRQHVYRNMQASRLACLQNSNTNDLSNYLLAAFVAYIQYHAVLAGFRCHFVLDRAIHIKRTVALFGDDLRRTGIKSQVMPAARANRRVFQDGCLAVWADPSRTQITGPRGAHI